MSRQTKGEPELPEAVGGGWRLVMVVVEMLLKKVETSAGGGGDAPETIARITNAGQCHS